MAAVGIDDIDASVTLQMGKGDAKHDGGHSFSSDGLGRENGRCECNVRPSNPADKRGAVGDAVSVVNGEPTHKANEDG